MGHRERCADGIARTVHDRNIKFMRRARSNGKIKHAIVHRAIFTDRIGLIAPGIAHVNLNSRQRASPRDLGLGP